MTKTPTQSPIKISVLTLTRNRTPHLKNLLKGLSLSSRLPDECIVVHMNEAIQAISDLPFPCYHHAYHSEKSALPLPEARNFAAEKAIGDLLIFLDVDCIPSNALIAAYEQAYRHVPEAITMGSVQYLKQSLDRGWTESSLLSQSEQHPKRKIPLSSSLLKASDYGLFWSLSFALHRSLFSQLGGFSDCYPSYGAEDTDFAWKARAQNISLLWVPKAMSFHQYHESQTPPWNNFKSIVYNARVFKKRWGHWPMESWLKVFAREGYIDWSMESDHLDVVRQPKAATN